MRLRGRHLVAIVFVVVWGLMTHGTFAGSGDEPHYMMIAHSLAFDGDLDLANDYREASLIGGGMLEPETHALRQGERLRPVHDIGMPLVFAPVVGVAYLAADWLGDALPKPLLDAARLNKALLLRHQISLVMAFLTGLLARELFLLLRQLGATEWSAFRWALLCALSPPILSHSFLFFTEVPSALVALVAFRRLSLSPVHTARMAAAIGGLVGLLLLVHVRNVGIVVGLTVVALLTLRRSAGPAAAFMMGVTLGTLARAGATWLLWGTLVTTPHATGGAIAPAGQMAMEIFTRATGLLFDREFGLLAYAPVYLLAVPGLLLLRGHAPLTRNLCLVLACYLTPVLLPVTNVHGWMGGWAPAARFLVPVAPLIWVAVYAYATQAAGAARALVAGLVVVQVAFNAYVWQFPKTLWNDGDGTTAFGPARWLPTWVGADAAPLFALALGALVATGWLCARSARTRVERGT
jgi:hypothetical protein